MSITGTETLSNKKKRIAIAGIGGVGGYYGGLLARLAEKRTDIEVVFISRNANLKKIQEAGLKVIAESETFITHPAITTDNASETGEVDYILLATKSYDLAETAEQIRPMVGKNTIILPLLNGIDNTSRLRAIFPDNEIWYGCAYIVARLNEPGVVESSGGVHYFHYGHEKKTSPELLFFEQVLLEAGIEASRKEEIIKAIWRKFFYISPTATLTSFLNTGFRDLVWDDDKKPVYVAMMQELLAISKAEGVELYENIIDDMLKYGGSLPAGTTSSMNTDFLSGRKTELETLTGSVVALGHKHGIPVPEYERAYECLKSRKN
jgi:2-dehydropantoate 2-reductase